MLSFLKAPANAPLITDKHEVDAPLSLLAAAYPDHHLVGLRAVLFHP